MEKLEKVRKGGYYGQLVFVKAIKNINYDGYKEEEVYEYYDKLKAGFILEISRQFEEYYLVKFFTGEKSYHWGVDLFFRKDEEMT